MHVVVSWYIILCAEIYKYSLRNRAVRKFSWIISSWQSSAKHFGLVLTELQSTPTPASYRPIHIWDRHVYEVIFYNRSALLRLFCFLRVVPYKVTAAESTRSPTDETVLPNIRQVCCTKLWTVLSLTPKHGWKRKSPAVYHTSPKGKLESLETKVNLQTFKLLI